MLKKSLKLVKKKPKSTESKAFPVGRTGFGMSNIIYRCRISGRFWGT